MALRYFKCIKCGFKDLFFDHEDKTCPQCGRKEFKKMLSVPMPIKNVETTNKYHNVKAIKNIEQDVKDRNTKHMNDTLDDLIEEFGEQIALEQGWLIRENGKLRKRNDFDTGTLGKNNLASLRRNK